MRSFELLDYLRSFPGSYVENRNGEFYLLDADGDALTHEQVLYRHIDRLVAEGRVMYDGRKRYIFTAYA